MGTEACVSPGRVARADFKVLAARPRGLRVILDSEADMSTLNAHSGAGKATQRQINTVDHVTRAGAEARRRHIRCTCGGGGRVLVTGVRLVVRCAGGCEEVVDGPGEVR